MAKHWAQNYQVATSMHNRSPTSHPEQALSVACDDLLGLAKIYQ